MPNKPELLSPAGDPERLQMAVRYGADAVYLAGKSYGMRAKCGNFSDEELKEAVAFCHSRGVKVYVTANVLARTGEIRQMAAFLRALSGHRCRCLYSGRSGRIQGGGALCSESGASYQHADGGGFCRHGQGMV